MSTLAAEVVMTFIQLARDEFGMFVNDKHVKESPRSYEKLQIRENLATIFRNLKNRMSVAGVADRYDAMLECIADNADVVDDELSEIHSEFKSNVTQSMRYDYQTAFMYATMTYMFVYAAGSALEIYMHTRKGDLIEETLKLLDKIPEAYGWTAWKPLNETVKGEWCVRLIDKVVTHSIEKRKRNAVTMNIQKPQMRQFDMKGMCDRLINKAI